MDEVRQLEKDDNPHMHQTVRQVPATTTDLLINRREQIIGISLILIQKYKVIEYDCF